MLDRNGEKIDIGDYVIDSWKDLSKIMRITDYGDSTEASLLPILNKSHMATTEAGFWTLASSHLTKVSADEALIYSLGGKIEG